MNIETIVRHGKRSNVAFAYSTKDRTGFTRQTLEPILREQGDFDLFWIDGSATEAGRGLTNFEDDKIAEVHRGINAGAAHAIQYSLVELYNRGYDYIGLIENDVLLFRGWFRRIMGLWKLADPDGDNDIGAVSVRCFTHRMLMDYKEDGYADMANIGAGMILFKREMVPHIIHNWRMPKLWEVRAICEGLTDCKYPVPPLVLSQDPKLEQMWTMTHDWFFEPVIWGQGKIAVACVPSMAINLDDPNGHRDPVEGVELPLK